ncbi:hypothetical protein BDD43_0674 [Mucilaginibacter gracilis]|uniref:Uncharacterized protein n=1 Tax=Mucilaginibacter gracilis TaxID=423350 RepID=A0A495IVQ0_9SPHI|nr:hypothetical protein [Mucilaginibacter gracilis]RKR80553.1 hypothetical protein BDD43_0674 [Mucilaginibacter gracilis]
MKNTAIVALLLLSVSVRAQSRKDNRIDANPKKTQFYYYVTFDQSKRAGLINFLKDKIGKEQIVKDSISKWNTAEKVEFAVSANSISISCDSPKIDQHLLTELTSITEKVSELTEQKKIAYTY